MLMEYSVDIGAQHPQELLLNKLLQEDGAMSHNGLKNVFHEQIKMCMLMAIGPLYLTSIQALLVK